MSIPIKLVRPYDAICLARCKAISDFNDIAKIRNLHLLYKYFSIFLHVFLLFSLIIHNFVSGNI